MRLILLKPKLACSISDNSTADLLVNNIKMVKGVKVACKGDIETLGFRPFTAVDVPSDHPVFSQPIPPISKRIDFPLRTYQYGPDKAWKDLEGNPRENPGATFLHMSIAVNGDSWGFAPERFWGGGGSLLAVGVNEDIMPEQIEALCDYCTNKVQPVLEEASEAGDFIGKKTARKKALKEVTWAKYKQHLDGMREDKIKAGDNSWADASLPAR